MPLSSSPPPSSSSSSSQKYQVFLSFQGADSRDNFVSHLYDALQRQGILTFKDDSELDKGQKISTILDAIEESSICVVIFSKNYASSKWCLKEIAKIIECMETHKLKVLPVFYEVDPEDVKRQTGSFAVAFAQLEKMIKNEDTKELQRWRAALNEAAKIGGWESKKTRPDSVLVREIVKDILTKLKHLYPNDLDDLVELGSQKRIIDSFLQSKHEGVQFVGIWGMSGAGKTSIARAIFNRISSQFEGNCFLKNVKELIQHGREQIQHEMLAKIFSEGNKFGGKYNWRLNQLCHKKVLIVLDDVDDCEQLEILTGRHDWFGFGSKVIITSKDKDVFQGRVDKIFEVQSLTNDEALRLFSHFAFEEYYPKKDFVDLSNRVITYAKGLPLVLKVLGSFLCSKSIEEWESALNKYERTRTPNIKILNVLRISYDGLDHEEKEIFLHIACFFRGYPVSFVIDILDALGFSTLIGLRVLADRALIIISSLKNIEMHDLLQDVAREIVRQENKDPGKRSRLWNYDDIYCVLRKNVGTEVVQSIVFDQSKIVGHLDVGANSFANMKQLKLLKFHNNSRVLDSFSLPDLKTIEKKVHLPQGLDYLSEELRYMKWDMYAWKCLPSNFGAEKLVELDLSGSQVEKLWTDVQNLTNLKRIKLRHCRHLIEIPDLSMALNLEEIDCTGCTSLLKVSSSIQNLKNLLRLHFGGCVQITNFPSTTSLSSLCYLCLGGCSNINEFPNVSTNIEWLLLDGTSIEEVPSSIKSLTRLVSLSLSKCKKLKYIRSEFYELESLSCLSISGPYVTAGLEKIFDHLCLHSLRYLHLGGNDFVRIPMSIKKLSCLEGLDLDSCFKLRYLPELPKCVQLSANRCYSLVSILGIAELEVEDFVSRVVGRLWFINCSNMDKSTSCHILEQTRKRIWLLAKTSIMNPKVKVAGKAFEITTVLPGNKFPIWIEFQNKGSSISIPLTPNSCGIHKIIVGVVLCVAFAFEDGRKHEKCKIGWECQFKCNNGESIYFSISFDCWRSLNVKGEHIFVMYNSDFLLRKDCELEEKWLDSSQFVEISLNAHFMDSLDSKPVPYMKIIKCGVQPILLTGEGHRTV